MVTFETACEICPFGSPEEPACYPTPEQLSELGNVAMAEIAPCAFRRLAETRYDPLTRLNSHQTFQEKLQQIFAHERANDMRHILTAEGDILQRPGGFIFIDGERVHELNHEIGHGTVDLGLIAMAQTLTDNLRDGDLSCRRSGDEFVVFLPGTVQEVSGVVERLRTKLELGVSWHSKGRDYTMAARLHLQHEPHISSYEQALAMIETADRLLGAAKRRRDKAGNS